MQKILVTLGISCIVAGLLWPWLAKIPLGRLPGDIIINRPHMKIYIPITTMIIISVILSLIIRFFKK
jgi:hypothetical protein